MIGSIVLDCVIRGIIIFLPYLFLYQDMAAKVVDEENEKKPIWKKCFWILLTFFCIAWIAWFVVTDATVIANGIYNTRVGVVTESEKFNFLERKNLNMYTVDIELEEGSIKEGDFYYDVVYAKHLKKGDLVEIRESVESLVIKRNGEETEYYKKHKDSWMGNLLIYKIILTLIIVLNLLLNLKLGMLEKAYDWEKRKKGVLFRNLWNIGCLIFSFLMLRGFWMQKHYTFNECYIWDKLLIVIFVMYQMAGYVYSLKNVGNHEIEPLDIEQNVLQEEPNEYIKSIDFECPNCGGKMIMTEDQLHKKCLYCHTELLLSEEELEHSKEIVEQLQLLKRNHLDIIKEICIVYEPKESLLYIAGYSLIHMAVCDKAKKNFKIPEEDDVFFICDTSRLHTGKLGFALCSSGIYYRFSWLKRETKKYTWQEFKKVPIQAIEGIVYFGEELFYEFEYDTLGNMFRKIQNEI